MPTLRREIFALLSQRFRTMQNHIVTLGKQTAQERVAAFLVMLFETVGANSLEPFEIPMSRQDVADYLALRIETISRVMTVLTQEHFIAMSDSHKIAVNNVDALRFLSRRIDRD